jgi:hypothetical protein
MSGSRLIGRTALPLLLTAVTLTGAPAAQAQRSGQSTVPAETVLRLKMDTALNSRSALKGDVFAAVLMEDDRSGFPEGARFQGVVREVQRRTDSKPGMLDVELRHAYLPDGAKMAVNGRLASLAGDDVRRMENGRLEARKNSGGKMDWKWAGYGAGAGAVLSGVLGGKVLKGALLGGLGGAVYGYLARDKGDKDSYRDVDLPRGTEFGIRLEQEAPFANRSTYRYAANEEQTERARAESDRRDDLAATERYDLRYHEATVRLNGKLVSLDVPPMNLNGVLYVPLKPIAAAANLRFTHYAGQETFALVTSEGRVGASAGESRITLANRGLVTLTEAPVSMNGAIYVSTDYLSRAADLSARWDAATLRLELTQR